MKKWFYFWGFLILISSTLYSQYAVDPDSIIFKFDPIDIGNKWIYAGKIDLFDNRSSEYVYSKEIIKDTILANQQIFKKIKTIYLDSSSKNVSYFYERIDSSNGNAYFWDFYNNVEYLCADLNMNLNEDLNTGYRFEYDGNHMSVKFSDLTTKNIFNFEKENHDYYIDWMTMGSDNAESYSLTKDFGVTYHNFTQYFGFTDIYNLKGAVIKGVHYGDTSFVVGIRDKKQVQPHDFALSQNFPNPFNPTTTINYSLPKAGNVNLAVYNAIGSRVATIVNEYKLAGNYSVQFNASKLASGIYFYRLESGNNSSSKKLILLK